MFYPIKMQYWISPCGHTLILTNTDHYDFVHCLYCNKQNRYKIWNNKISIHIKYFNNHELNNIDLAYSLIIKLKCSHIEFYDTYWCRRHIFTKCIKLFKNKFITRLSTHNPMFSYTIINNRLIFIL